MSTMYGFYNIAICKKNGQADQIKAKEVFNYCMNTFEWFAEDNHFMLEGNEIKHNEKEWCEGLDVKHTDIPVDFDWLCEAQSETEAERIVGQIIEDYTEAYYDENYVHQAIIENGEIVKQWDKQFDRNMELDGFQIDDFGEIDSGSSYQMLNKDFSTYQAKFKNKKTGQEFLGGILCLYPNEGYEEEGTLASACHSGECHFVFSGYGDQANLLGENNEPTDIWGFNHFSDDYDIMKDFDLDTSEWEFVGFAAQPGFFDLYAKNPPALEFEVF